MASETAGKIIIALERISEAFKSMLWLKAKEFGLSPIQIQILLFVSNHKEELCNVSHLAKEFNLTKPTISDVIKVLEKKAYITKSPSAVDARRFNVILSPTGTRLIDELEEYHSPFKQLVDQLGESQLEVLYQNLTSLVFQLNRAGILSVQRTCFGCIYHQVSDNKHHCRLLGIDLAITDIRLDCPDYVEK